MKGYFSLSTLTNNRQFQNRDLSVHNQYSRFSPPNGAVRSKRTGSGRDDCLRIYVQIKIMCKKRKLVLYRHFCISIFHLWIFRQQDNIKGTSGNPMFP